MYEFLILSIYVCEWRGRKLRLLLILINVYVAVRDLLL